MKITNLLPNKIRYYLKVFFNISRLSRDYVYDMRRFLKWTATNSINSQQKLIGRIIVHYHILEKGMNFEKMRPGYGQEIAKRLVELLNTYVELGYNKSDYQFKVACSVLSQYFEVNKSLDLAHIRSGVNFYIDNCFDSAKLGGKRYLKKEDIDKVTAIDFKSFFESRHSIREFSEENVDVEYVFRALDIAKKYPSVCNRQSIRVYLIQGKDKVSEHLSYQNGNRGFNESINTLLVVTSDLSLFDSSLERNQPFIDGGIYLMGVLLSLHSVGLGAVTLNWSTSKKMDEAYRNFSNIKESETIIAFIGVGHLKEEMTVPCSERNNIKDILTEL